MRRLSFLLIAALCLLTPSSILVAQSPTLTPFRGLIDHLTVEPSGWSNASGDIWHNAISGDGRFVAFQSQSSTIAADDYEDYNGWAYQPFTSVPVTVGVRIGGVVSPLPSNRRSRPKDRRWK